LTEINEPNACAQIATGVIQLRRFPQQLLPQNSAARVKEEEKTADAPLTGLEWLDGPEGREVAKLAHERLEEQVAHIAGPHEGVQRLPGTKGERKGNKR
jgi:hypothetical protein